MKYILLCTFLLLVSSHTYSQDSIPIINEVKVGINPLDTLNFNEIIAYTINYDTAKKRRTHFQISQDPKKYDLTPWRTSSKRIVDTTLFDSILLLFSDTSTYGDTYASCFEPRFVLQFKNNDKEVFRIIICEGCGFLISTLPIPSAYSNYFDSPYEEDGKKVIYRRYMKGFTAIGASKINRLCKTLKMAYCQQE